MMAVPFVPEAGGIEVITLTDGDIWKDQTRQYFSQKKSVLL
jgi:hypothetical protein